MKRYATISPCGTYRYWLERVWAKDPECMDKGYVNFIMLNPSTADAEVDDPTIRKCIGFAQRWGYAAMHVVNLFAYRATNPARLKTARDPIGPENDAMIEASVLSADRTIVAWGKMGSWMGRDAAVRKLLDPARTFALRLNNDGSPAHPLYIPYDAEPVTFASAQEARP